MGSLLSEAGVRYTGLYRRRNAGTGGLWGIPSQFFRQRCPGIDEGTEWVGEEPAHPRGHELFRPIITIDKTLHEPSRLAIVALLSSMEDIDFRFLKKYIGLSQGNLSSHIHRLEKAK